MQKYGNLSFEYLEKIILNERSINHTKLTETRNLQFFNFRSANRSIRNVKPWSIDF